MNTENRIVTEKLSFTDFMSAFRAQYKYGWPQLKRNFHITEQIIHKNNRNLHGIIVRSAGTRVAPVFYYEDFYEAYLKGTAIEECIGKIVQFVTGQDFGNCEIYESLSDYEKISQYLILKVINFKKNKSMLKTMPHRLFGDMAVIVQVYLDDPSIGRGAVNVDETLVSLWATDAETVFSKAEENMKKYRIKSIDLMDLVGNENYDNDSPRIYVISYDAPFHGASAILRTDYLQDFTKSKQKDFFLLPVSIHEFLLIEKKEDIREEMMKEMLHSINIDKNLNDNMLSDEVYSIERGHEKPICLSSGKELTVSCKRN
ncbi:MAG: hypothetical protein J5379_10515 [Clostridiales bacterium]|nr:hypothetical protein [Clostridiales bacterium]